MRARARAPWGLSGKSARIAEAQRLGGSPIERRFGRSEVATKPELKGNYLLARIASLHRNAITSDAVTRFGED
jgi:hypothetical protein